MKLPILTNPNQILRNKSVEINTITPQLLELAQNMLETMVLDGIGLAAPQVGQNIRLIVIGNEKPSKHEKAFSTKIMFNPTIISKSKETDLDSEGCLSLPGISGVVKRNVSVLVKYTNENNEVIKYESNELEARAIQHEIDHLDGKLFIDRLKKYRIVYFGTPEFSIAPLASLIAHLQFDVVGVVTETDKKGGRGHNLLTSPVKDFALKNHIPLLQPTTFNTNHVNSTLANEAKITINNLRLLKPDFYVVAAYGKILPQEVLNIASIAPINIHPSILPLYRGADPIRGAIINGDNETGVSIMLMVPKMDAGAVLTLAKSKINLSDTYETLTNHLSNLGSVLLTYTLENIIADKAEIFEQNESKATFTHKYSTEDRIIDWGNSAKSIHDQIRAFSPNIGVITKIENQEIFITHSSFENENLIIEEVQIPGKSKVSLANFKNGHRKIYDELIKLVNGVNSRYT
jgi:methionyl-tRNA formyltransferase